MEELSLTEIKQIEFEILKHFKNYCEKNAIRYYLSNGTLLGAVKYKGFIPWDDDIDVFVPRADYNRLTNEYFVDGKIKLLCRERDSSYVFPFAKLIDTSTEMQKQTILKNYMCGVHIDIFPLDYWNDNLDISIKKSELIKSLGRNLGFSIAHFSKGRTFLRTCVKNLCIAYARIRGYSYYHRKLIQEINRCLNAAGINNCGCIVWPVYGKHEIIPAEVFADTIEVEFEGEKFPAPIGYDTYLRSLYGDYEKDPPLEKQKTHHRFKAYRL